MLDWVLSPFLYLIERMLSLLGIFGSSKALEPGGTQIVIKAVNGESLSVVLRPGWNILDVKTHIAPKLNLEPEELKIIFAGKELRDDVSLEACDLGNQSILHAVKILTKVNERKASESVGEDPLCESLIDLQLTQEERSSIPQEDRESRKAHFYVWCNACHSLQAGKLRVRCCDCGEGAILLDRDPADWQDVLERNRIPGYCESSHCLKQTHVQFFFKCGNKVHVDSEEVPPLYLVKSNLRDVPCLACTDLMSPVLVMECKDRHVVCVQCFENYAKSRLNERQFVLDPEVGYTLPCPVGCEGSLIREPRHFHLMGDLDYHRYQRFGCEELVLASGGVLCPQPGCGSGILPDLTEECRRVQCGECGFVFCRDCLQGAHIGPCLPCTGSDDLESGPAAQAWRADDPRAIRASWLAGDPTSLTIRISTKPCPRCRTPTERDGGCMHMICTKPGCGLHWCWVCQTEWTRDCMASHWFG